MRKQYVVRLTEEERAGLLTLIGCGLAPAPALEPVFARSNSMRSEPLGGTALDESARFSYRNLV